jgi:hypothetical protein
MLPPFFGLTLEGNEMDHSQFKSFLADRRTKVINSFSEPHSSDILFSDLTLAVKKRLSQVGEKTPGFITSEE